MRSLQAGRHPALLGRAVENREVELLVGGIERGEKIKHLIDHLGGARVSTVDLVDDHDGLEAHLERLRHDELGLRQRTLGGIDKHQCAIDHIENAFDLAAEIGVARRIDDVDAGAVPDNRSGFSQNGNATLAFEVIGIHGALDHALVLAIRPGLLQQAVDQGRFAMVDMRDNGDVAKIHRSS